MNEVVKALKSKFLDKISIDSMDLKEYGRDWTRYKEPNPLAIFFPKNHDDVLEFIIMANRLKFKVVPSGGRTGLSGGAMATNQEVVISMEKMNQVLEFNEVEQSISVQAGMITEDLQNYVKDKNYLFPVDFASRGSSQIGGNIATNAGGIKVIKYGLFRNWVSSIKVVTGKGETLELNQGLIKNATGYDLRHLFIGSEGTLGIITEATLQFTRQPNKLELFLFAVEKLDSVMKVFSEFRKNIEITAFEFFDSKALKYVLEANPTLSPPFKDEKHNFYLLVEIETHTREDLEKASLIFEKLMENNTIQDGLLSQNDTQFKTFWKFREDVAESVSKHTPYKNDISVRISKVPEFMNNLNKIFTTDYPNFEVIWFGHIGDGNLHISILKPKNLEMTEFVKACQKVDTHLYTAIQKLGGSISAEHGVGLSKKPFLQFTRSKEELTYFKQIKNLFDPDGILNPGKIFD